jgi:hypothetical protein
MKKVLLAVAHYGSSNRARFLQCFKEYCSFQKYEITAHLFLTEDFNCDEFRNIDIIKHIYAPSVGQMLVQKHKQTFVEERRNFDYYLYCEDDVFITENNVDTYVTIQSVLPSPFSCGFLRYEYKGDNPYKFLFDNHPVNSVHCGGTTTIKGNYIINNIPFFEVYNVHQGCYLLTQELMNKAIDSGKYLESHNYYAGGPLEGAASDVYFKCGVTKVIPRSRVSDLLVHHLPNKYVHMREDVYTEDTTPDDVKIATMQTELQPIYV